MSIGSPTPPVPSADTKGNRRLILEELTRKIGTIEVNGAIINAINTWFEPSDYNDDLPVAAVIPEAENIEIGLMGVHKERRLPIDIIIAYYAAEESLFLDGEDIVEAVVKALTAEAYVNTMKSTFSPGCGFSIERIGPIVIEQAENSVEWGIIGMPLQTIFIED